MGDLFSEKLQRLEDKTERKNKLADAIKQINTEIKELQEWVKNSLAERAKKDSVEKVQAVFDRTTYTVETGKRYKNPAPTQKQIPNLLERYFSSTDFDVNAFVSATPKERADALHESIWGNRGYRVRTTLSRKKK